MLLTASAGESGRGGLVGDAPVGARQGGLVEAATLDIGPGGRSLGWANRRGPARASGDGDCTPLTRGPIVRASFARPACLPLRPCGCTGDDPTTAPWPWRAGKGKGGRVGRSITQIRMNTGVEARRRRYSSARGPAGDVRTACVEAVQFAKREALQLSKGREDPSARASVRCPHRLFDRRPASIG